VGFEPKNPTPKYAHASYYLICLGHGRLEGEPVMGLLPSEFCAYLIKS